MNNKLEDITVSQIASTCHISRGTFYRYFSGVSELLAGLEDEMLAGIESYMDNTVFD